MTVAADSNTATPASVFSVPSHSRTRRRWYLVGLAIAAAIALACFLAVDTKNAVGFDQLIHGKPVTATVLFVVDPKPANFFTDKPAGPTDQQEYENFRRIQASLVRSQPVLAKVVKQADVQKLSIIQDMKDASEWLMQALKVDFEEGPGLMRVSLSGSKGSELLPLLGAIAHAYLHKSADIEQQGHKERLEQLQRISQELSKNLRQREEVQYDILAASTPAARSGPPMQIAREDLIDLQRELRRVQLAKEEVSTRLNYQETASKKEKTATMSTDRLKEDLAVLEAKEKLLQQQIPISAMRVPRRAAPLAASQRVQAEITDLRDAFKKVSRQMMAVDWEMRVSPRVRLFGEPYIVPGK